MKKSKLRVSSALSKKRSRKNGASAKKHCRFKNNPELEEKIDYKNVDFLRSFLTERFKILPSRVSGNSAFYQRKVARQIKIARSMALLPFCSVHHV